MKAETVLFTLIVCLFAMATVAFAFRDYVYCLAFLLTIPAVMYIGAQQ